MVKAILILVLFLILPAKVLAIYDPLSVPNNRLGVHLLEPAEIEKAAGLVNSSGGDWGYVTIPIRANDRDLAKWIKFMEEARKLHIIPILRIASFPVGDHWMAPNEYDLIDFANFLDQLPWPTQNRYVVVYNEPNHKNEWGGFVYPEEYAKVLDRAVDIFHKTNANFFVISAGFDSSAPNSSDSLNEYVYMQIMDSAVPEIFSKIDGFSSHSYGNPGFASPPNIYSPVSIANYRFEGGVLASYGVGNPKIFITEAGWRWDLIGQTGSQRYLNQAFDLWQDANIVAITPFVLFAQTGPFAGFSFTDANGQLKVAGQILKDTTKIAGQPRLDTSNPTKIASKPPTSSLPPTSLEGALATLWQRFLAIFSR